MTQDPRPKLLSVAEAHRRLLALVAPLPAESVGLAQAGGRVLIEDVVAGRDQPPFDASAMDGYAARAADAAAGARLRVTGASQAGQRFGGAVGIGEAVRIFTGAPMPAGADTVVIQEDVERDGDAIVLREAGAPGANIRPAGGDFKAGARIAAPRRLTPANVALAAAMNARRLRVTRRPIVALIPTGDELVAPGGAPGPDQIIASNNYGLKAMIEAAGAEARLLPIAGDTPESLTSVFELAAGADLIVTLGGASVGDFDLVQSTAVAQGLQLDFYKVAMRPGKPLLAGRIGDQALIGLPGNPVSAMICGQVFVLPVIERMLGLAGEMPRPLGARLTRPVSENGPRTHYLRSLVEVAEDGSWACTPFTNQDSSLLSVLTDANALMVRPPSEPARHPDELVEFIWI